MQNSSQNVSVVRRQYFSCGCQVAEVPRKQIHLLFQTVKTQHVPDLMALWVHTGKTLQND